MAASPLDIIELPGQPGKYARRAVVQAWVAAGSPWVNSAGRLYAEQKRLYDGYRRGLPGFNPADNPDDPTQQLAHVRFVALDIDPTPDRVRRLTAAGLVRPFWWESWHWTLPGDMRRYSLVTSIPLVADSDSSAFPAPTASEEDDMFTDADRALLLEIKTRIRGRNPNADLLQIIEAASVNTERAAVDTQRRVRGDNPNADMLQEIRAFTSDTARRVRGERPDVDMLQDILGRVGGAVDVDEAQLAAELAPYLAQHLSRLPDETIAALAKAVNDEDDRRDQERQPAPTPPPAPADPWKSQPVDSPLATWVGSPNYNYRVAREKTHIDLHWMVGTLASCDATFQNPGAIVNGRGTNASAQYGVGADAVHQYVKEADYSHANGNADANATGITIEHEGGWLLSDGKRAVPSRAVLDRSAKLCADIAKRRGWTRLEWMVNVFPHKHYVATECPGTLDTAYIIAEANKILGAAS